MRDFRHGGSSGSHGQVTEAEIMAKVEAAIIEELLKAVDEQKYIGPKARIYFYRETKDNCPAEAFLNRLQKASRASYGVAFTRHCNGERVRGEQHRIWEGYDSLWEYKHNPSQTRLIHTMDKGNVYVLLFGFDGKKEDRVDQIHVNRAIRMQEEYKRRRDAIETRVRQAYGKGGIKRG